MNQTEAEPAPPLPHPRDVVLDADLAVRLAAGRPTGAAADALRERLRGYIRALAGPADAYAQRLADNRAKDIAVNTVAHARKVADDRGGDPVASLRLLGKSAEILSRYTAAASRPPAPSSGRWL